MRYFVLQKIGREHLQYETTVLCTTRFTFKNIESEHYGEYVCVYEETMYTHGMNLKTLRWLNRRKLLIGKKLRLENTKMFSMPFISERNVDLFFYDLF